MSQKRGQRWGHTGRNEGGKAWLCKIEHPGARSGKTEGRGGVAPEETRMVRLGFAKPSTHVLDLAKLDLQETGAVRVGVTGPVKTRTVRLGFAKPSIRVLAFANPRVGGG